MIRLKVCFHFQPQSKEPLPPLLTTTSNQSTETCLVHIFLCCGFINDCLRLALLIWIAQMFIQVSVDQKVAQVPPLQPRGCKKAFAVRWEHPNHLWSWGAERERINWGQALVHHHRIKLGCLLQTRPAICEESLRVHPQSCECREGLQILIRLHETVGLPAVVGGGDVT